MARELDDKADKLVLVMKTEPGVWLNKHKGNTNKWGKREREERWALKKGREREREEEMADEEKKNLRVLPLDLVLFCL